jgi:hypothetical protein
MLWREGLMLGIIIRIRRVASSAFPREPPIFSGIFPVLPPIISSNIGWEVKTLKILDLKTREGLDLKSLGLEILVLERREKKIKTKKIFKLTRLGVEANY